MTCFRDDGRDEKDFQTYPVHPPMTRLEVGCWFLVLVVVAAFLVWRASS